ncbi:serine/threonine dehydratase [Burkholderiaceae bacterium FT117]|uniref:serine/threonine dehydratase n=1 Tax=Zeimonas sediminis TaxID=2944268 RepID=UPI0023430E06|nr:serine/threonine dehydratase [Zeimonas sediminis]MCM5571203.1 serine/threonine dehydratase [Zeimonas sediminis]
MTPETSPAPADSARSAPGSAAAAPIDRSRIRHAWRRIAGRIRQTPTIDVEVDGRSVNLKLECLQRAGSFKARGAFNRLLAALEGPESAEALRGAGVVAASGGNHGIAVALAAADLGVPAHIFLPANAPAAKKARLRALGAALHLHGERYADAFAASQAFAAETGAIVAHAYDQDEILAGQGTVALEWALQRPDLDTLLIAVGGGGLIGGIAAWHGDAGHGSPGGDPVPGGTAPAARIVAVEPRACPTLHEALAAGRIVDVSPGGLAADSLGASRVGERMFPIAQRHVAASVLVEDDAIRDAQRWLWQHLRLAVEPGGAAAFAALRSGAWQPPPGARIGVLACGANVDPATLADSQPGEAE